MIQSTIKDLCLEIDPHHYTEKIAVYDFDGRKFYEEQNKQYTTEEASEE